MKTVTMNSGITSGLLCEHEHFTLFFHHSLNRNRRQKNTGFGGMCQVNKAGVRSSLTIADSGVGRFGCHGVPPRNAECPEGIDYWRP